MIADCGLRIADLNNITETSNKMKSLAFIILLWLVASTGLSALAPVQAADPAVWDAAFEQIARYQFGQSRTGLAQVAEHVVAAMKSPALQSAMEKRLLKLLQSDATTECKRFVCRQLYLIGSAESVPVLASLLTDSELADMARYALEPIPHPSVDAALRQALAKTQGKLKAGVIYSLGARQDSQATELLVPCLIDPDHDIARAAIATLEKVGWPTAIDAFQKALSQAPPARRVLLADALLTCANQLLIQGNKAAAEKIFLQFYRPSEIQAVRMAALRGLLVADSHKYFPLLLVIFSSEQDSLQAIAADHLRYMPGNELTKRIIAELPKLSASAQAKVLAALGDRKDPAALPAIVGAVSSADETISVAALAALGRLGGADNVALLADNVAAPSVRKSAAAQASLNQLRGAEVDARILQCLNQRDSKTQNELIRCLAERVAVTALPALVKTAQTGNPALRNNLYKALGALAELKDLPALTQLLAQAKDEATVGAAENAIATACSRQADQAKCLQVLLADYSKASTPARCALLRVLGTMGITQVLPTVREALKESNAQVQDTALRVLANWPTAEPAGDLLQVVRQTSDLTRRVLALRGYVSMAGLPSLSGETRLKMYRQALEQAQRPEEKKLALGGLASVNNPQAMQVAQTYLDDATVKAEAALAIVKIAGAIKEHNPEAVRAPLQMILAASADAGLKSQAQKILDGLPPASPGLR
jgi:HEAT repeat protein